MLTKVFKSGNSLAVRIPRKMVIAAASEEVEIERIGNTLLIRPAAEQTLAGIGDIFSLFSPGFMADGREFHEETARDWASSDDRDGG